MENEAQVRELLKRQESCFQFLQSLPEMDSTACHAIGHMLQIATNVADATDMTAASILAFPEMAWFFLDLITRDFLGTADKTRKDVSGSVYVGIITGGIKGLSIAKTMGIERIECLALTVKSFLWWSVVFSPAHRRLDRLMSGELSNSVAAFVRREERKKDTVWLLLEMDKFLQREGRLPRYDEKVSPFVEQLVVEFMFKLETFDERFAATAERLGEMYPDIRGFVWR